MASNLAIEKNAQERLLLDTVRKESAWGPGPSANLGLREVTRQDRIAVPQMPTRPLDAQTRTEKSKTSTTHRYCIQNGKT